jgi:predicted HD phosphohydrolase
LNFKQLREVPSSDKNASILRTVSLRHARDDSMNVYFERIKQTPNRTLYLSIDMNFVNNPAAHVESLYPIEKMTNQYATNQINDITMAMPEVVALYDWNMIPQVSRKFLQ